MSALELLEQGRSLGEEFLIWLWMRGLTAGGASLDGDDHSACFLDDSIQLASEHGEVKRVTLAQGNPAESQEGFLALARGMRPVRAKVRILSSDLEWVFTLTAATLGISAMKMPASAAKGQADLLSERAFLLEEGLGHLERRLEGFLRGRSGNSEEMEVEVKTWIQEGIAGDSGVLKQSA